jgi:fructose-1,6-bisphosphatase/inositol monophosphatase family enzyme
MAAGTAIVRAAGGIVHVLDRPTRPAPLVVAAGPRLVDALVTVLRESGALDPSE